jgi:uncharacterized membrane protein
MSWQAASLGGQALLYAIAGAAHFRLEPTFLRVMPPWVPYPRWTNRAAGAIEMLLALGLLWPGTRRWALLGALALLVAVFPVHLHMLRDERASLGWPRWALWGRLPIQALLMVWAAASL